MDHTLFGSLYEDSAIPEDSLKKCKSTIGDRRPIIKSTMKNGHRQQPTASASSIPADQIASFSNFLRPTQALNYPAMTTTYTQRPNRNGHGFNQSYIPFAHPTLPRAPGTPIIHPTPTIPATYLTPVTLATSSAKPASEDHPSSQWNSLNHVDFLQDMSQEVRRIDDSISRQTMTVSPKTFQQRDVDTDSDRDEDDGLTHPNKFPVEIEYHENKHCLYKRQNTRSGPKIKQRKSTVYNPSGPSLTGTEVQQIKYFQKDLVRICRCGKYSQMDGALIQGRTNDCDGYEIHYSQKCKWKAYDDYKTGKRVLIRLCKCYKPML